MMAKFEPAQSSSCRKSYNCSQDSRTRILELGTFIILLDSRTRHIYYSSCLFPSQVAYKWSKCILKRFLWDKKGGAKGFSLVIEDVCTYS
jgi:hypothetical protein